MFVVWGRAGIKIISTVTLTGIIQGWIWIILGDISLSQSWHDSILLWSLVGDTERERGGWGENFLIFSGKDASLCALPLSIFKPFTVLKLASHWSHWSHWSSFTWFHRQLVGFQTSYHRRRLWDFFARISSPRLPFLLRVDGLFLFGILVGRVALPSLVSNEKVKEEPMVMENLNTLPWVMTCQCLAEVQSLVGHGGVTESVTLTAVIFGVYIWTFNFEVRKWNMLSLVCP